MVERSFLCCSVFARAFQADMAYGSFHFTESPVAHRIRLPVGQLTLHIFFSRKSESPLIDQRTGIDSDTCRRTST